MAHRNPKIVDEDIATKPIDPENPPISSEEFAKAIPTREWISRNLKRSKA